MEVKRQREVGHVFLLDNSFWGMSANEHKDIFNCIIEESKINGEVPPFLEFKIGDREYTYYTGKKMMKLTAGASGPTKFRQSVELVPGTYVRSAYINTAEANNFSADSVYLEADGGSDGTFTSTFVDYQTSASIDGGWTRAELTFTASSGGNYLVGAVVNNGVGTVLVDDFQLEKVPDEVAGEAGQGAEDRGAGPG